MPPISCPDHLLTIEEFDELPEDGSRRYELQEGVLQVSPKAAAGIQGYWVLEIDDVVKLTASRLIGEVYEVDFRGGGMFKTVHPFELELDLDALVRRSA
ncbi:hypothetical protein HUO13_01510 [Saccharopolyspora erythraea]|uniref:hypothetical protein n=1 Tax=Saccharopolyspora erythraea TaxID=1836 RepID=UPI001BA8A6A9|nr:hypothetical protein [Saccharopolyspora erythraea]QUG99647.1 hypothetical protein HUO13_01510 [Saccharopolyspora erythraea]